MPSLEPTANNAPADAQGALALFGVTGSVGAYGTRHVLYEYDEPVDYRRGPGQPAATTEPDDARAPKWWTVEAERIVLALVASGHRVTSDDLRERFSDEPSATGAAIGGVFRSMAARGQLVLVGHRPSSRPEARGRVVGIWAAGAPS